MSYNKGGIKNLSRLFYSSLDVKNSYMRNCIGLIFCFICL